MITLREIKEALLHSEKIRSVNGGVNRGTWATEQSVYAYAMFISTEFYVAVVEAFSLLAQGKTEEALDIAASFVVTPELVRHLSEKALSRFDVVKINGGKYQGTSNSHK